MEYSEVTTTHIVVTRNFFVEEKEDPLQKEGLGLRPVDAAYGRIKVDTGLSPGDEIVLSGQGLGNLRLWDPRPGEAFTIEDIGGALLRARLVELGPMSARLFVFEEHAPVAPLLDVTLLQALPDKERMELIIQKTTELGVTRIVPFKSQRSISLHEREARQRKAHRWGRIALKAAKQSRRHTIPVIDAFASLSHALERADGAELKIMLWEGRGIVTLRDLLRDKELKGIRSVALLSGPEGGFTPEEVERAERAGFNPVSLGHRILRTETASIAGMAVIQYEFGS